MDSECTTCKFIGVVGAEVICSIGATLITVFMPRFVQS